MPSTRDLLGDGAISKLTEQGLTPGQIRVMAKSAYDLQKEEQAKANEQRLSDATAMGSDTLRFGVGIAKGAMEVARGYAKIAEDNAKKTDANSVFDPEVKVWKGEEKDNPVDPYRTIQKEGEYSAPVEKSGQWIKRLEEYQKNYKSTNTYSGDTDIASFAGEAVGGFVDPVNLIPIGTASLAKRAIGFATTGALSGGVAAYGGDRNVTEGALTGAITAPVLGEAFHWAGVGIAKLWGKARDGHVKDAKDIKDFNDIAQNELFQNPLLKEDGTPSITPAHTDEKSFVDTVLKNEPDNVKAQVLQDVKDGKPSSIVDEAKYQDIVEFKKYLKTIDDLSAHEDTLRVIDKEVESVNEKIGLSTQSSVIRYNEMAKSAQKEYRDNPAILPTQIKPLMNAKFPPSPEEVMVTSWVNDGAPVENRLAGWNVLHAIEKDIQTPLRSPEEFALGLQKAGFGEEQVSVFTEAYAKRDISLAQNYFTDKISTKGAEYVTARGQEFSASKRNGDGSMVGGEASVPGEIKPNGDGTQGGTSDAVSNSEHQEPSLNNGERTLPNDGRDLASLGEGSGLSKSDADMEGFQATGSNSDGVPSHGGDTVVQPKDGNGDGSIPTDVKEVYDVPKEELNTKGQSDAQTSAEAMDSQSAIDGQSGEVAIPSKEITPQNVDLRDRDAVELSKGERKRINQEVDSILQKKKEDVSEADKEVLRKYTGNGGIESGTYGSLSEHYTPYETVRGVYDALDRAGVPMENALEPAVGSGNFVGHRPDLEWTTIDIDPKAHAINKILYPNAKHYNTSFENFKGGGYDAIISNVPFIETRGAGALKNRPDVKALHDYYFVSAVDKVKDGGVVSFVTSRGTMDKADFKVRKELMSKANIIGAYRLPEGTFSKNAHTDVGADVIFLQKRAEGARAEGKQLANNEAFIKSTKTEDGIYLNDYFQKNPEKILGDMEVGVNKQYGGKNYTVIGKADYSKMTLDYHNANASEALHVNKADVPHASHDFWDYVDENGLETHGLDESGIIIKDGEVKVADAKVEFSDIDGGAAIYKDITGSVEANKILRLNEIVNAGEAHDLKLGQKLITSYQKEFNVHPYKDKSLMRLFSDIGEKDKLYELGSYFDDTFKPAQIFDRETKFEGSGKVEVNADSPIQMRLMFHENNKGVVDIAKGGEYIKEGDLYNALDNGYSLSDKGQVQNDILYYSGNLYEKMDQVNTLMDVYKNDGIALSKLEKQLAQLEETLPARKGIEEINIRGDEPWLLQSGLEVYPIRKVERVIKKDEHVVKEFETGFGKVFDNYINSKALVSMEKEESLTSYRRRLRDANEEVQNVLGRIKEKILGNEKLTKGIEGVYNRKFNGYVSPDYKKASYLIKDVIDEIADPKLKLRENQTEWITKAIYEGKGINAHDVGGGKTLTDIVLIRALKRRGVLNKPLLTVPAKVIKNWEKEIRRAFPDAKVVNLFNLEKNTRAKKLFELGNNEADYVLISHEGFKELKLPRDVEMRYVDELMSENLKTEDLKGRALAIQEEKIKKYKEVLRKENADKRITIDKLGIDSIHADEARAFKNIGVNNKLVNFKLGKPFNLSVDLKGGITLDSALAYDFRFKTRYISEKNNGRNVYMLDATPTPNKPMEIYTMLKHLDNKIFDEYGIYSDRDFANRYFEFGAKMNKRGDIENGLVYIKNAYELRSIMDRYVNRISMQEFKDKGIISLPDEKVNTHYLDASDESDFVFSDIKNRLLAAKNDATQRSKVMGIFSEGVSASTDPRSYQRGGVRDFIDPTPDNNKLEAVVSKVLATREKNSRVGQIIFLDNAGHEQQLARDLDKTGAVYEATLDKNLHQEMKEKLIASGKYKPEEIAIISGKEITNPSTGKEVGSASGQKGAEMKQAIVDAYDKGDVKVIIGTTKGAGEGMNIQKFTSDIYHMDIPWTPAEITQRNGRGVRFGNENDLVNTHYFFQAGTFDELMYRTITNKRGWNEALWDAKVKDKIEIVDDDSAMPKEEEFMLQMEKDPLKRRVLELQIEYGRLENEFQAVNEEGYFLGGKRDSVIREIKTLENEIRALQEKLTSDKPNKYLGELLDTISKSKDAKKKADLQADYDYKLKNSRANIEKMIESKQKRITEQHLSLEKTKKAIEDNKLDAKEASSKLSAFEESHISEDGKIKAEILEEAC